MVVKVLYSLRLFVVGGEHIAMAIVPGFSLHPYMLRFVIQWIFDLLVSHNRFHIHVQYRHQKLSHTASSSTLPLYM